MITENTSDRLTSVDHSEVKHTQPPVDILQEEHIPVNGFNAEEIRAGMKMFYEVEPMIYKPAKKSAPTASLEPSWATEPNMTSDGKDFFLELRKQITALEGTPQGGTSARSLRKQKRRAAAKACNAANGKGCDGVPEGTGLSISRLGRRFLTFSYLQSRYRAQATRGVVRPLLA